MKAEDVEWVLRSPCCIYSYLILLKKWTPFFDANRERTNVLPIWVHLTGLQVEFRTKVSFFDLGNALGTFMDANTSFITSGKQSVAQILVSLNIRGGLAEELELICKDKHFFQKMEYEGIPFRCRCCHKHDHIVSDCKMSFHG
jgi:hypothetical protein